jgi:serine/threonine protein kinase
MQHVQKVPIPPSKRSKQTIPQEIDELVMACLHKDPNRRPRDASELLHLVSSIASDWDYHAARNWWQLTFPIYQRPRRSRRPTGPPTPILLAPNKPGLGARDSGLGTARSALASTSHSVRIGATCAPTTDTFGVRASSSCDHNTRPSRNLEQIPGVRSVPPHPR